MTLGKQIKALRKNKHLTQYDFAEKLNISRSTLSCYETGQRTPNIKTLQDIARICGVGLDYFGLDIKNEAFDLLARAQTVFESDQIPDETKEELYREFMKLYLKMKE